ncbi:hypothetical protein D3C76_981620 [compost metagenome]
METRRVGVGDDHRPARQFDGFQGAAFGAVGHVDEHADAVHLADDLAAEAADAVVFGFITAAGQQALVVIGQLHDQHAELTEDLDQADVVFDGRAVLEAEENPDAAFLMRQANVRGLAHRTDQLGPGFETAVPFADARQGFPGVFVIGDGGVDRAQAAGLHLAEDLFVPVGVLQAIDHQ